MNARLAIFDLDHTLLSGDTDVLWCAFLIARGVLDGATFAARSAELERRYRAGTVARASSPGSTPARWPAARRASGRPSGGCFLSRRSRRACPLPRARW